MTAPPLRSLRAVLRSEFPGVAARSVRRLAGGWDFRTLEVDRRWIFRIPLRAGYEVRLAREFALLPLLARRLPVPLPDYRLRRGPTHDFPHSIGGYRRLGGVRVDRAGLSPEVLARAGAELGRVVRALHRIPSDPLVRGGLPFRSARTVRAGVARWCRRVRNEVAPRLNATSRERFDRLARRLTSSALQTYSPVATHHDLRPAHVLVNSASGRISGLIDWGDLEFGDPAFDFGVMAAKPYLGPAMLRAYGGPSDPGFLERADGYRRLVASHGVVHANATGDRASRTRYLRAFLRALDSPGPAVRGASSNG
ncbi:MAG: phosphotransferase family protein [Thermoplasmata archaeon]